VKNIPGLGYKEASHFLRNIGLGCDLAILDRHIMRCLLECGVILEIPASLNRKRYLELEQKMKDFSAMLDIPLSHLDLVFWYSEKGEIFK
jgi:N-glycosylase/DNA lyase